MKTYTAEEMRRFVTESNAIEGIKRLPNEDELQVSASILNAEPGFITVKVLQHFVKVCQPGATLRTRSGQNVVVGRHYPPPGGPRVKAALENLLARIQTNGVISPYRAHVEYETLHPFMDGNGRSGRILWAWQMVQRCWSPVTGLSFLHAFYYQSLDGARKE